MIAGSSNFDYSSLKELLKDTNAEILTPTDGAAYEKSIGRWSEHCIKRAVSMVVFFSMQIMGLGK